MIFYSSVIERAMQETGLMFSKNPISREKAYFAIISHIIYNSNFQVYVSISVFVWPSHPEMNFEGIICTSTTDISRTLVLKEKSSNSHRRKDKMG